MVNTTQRAIAVVKYIRLNLQVANLEKEKTHATILAIAGWMTLENALDGECMGQCNLEPLSVTEGEKWSDDGRDLLDEDGGEPNVLG